MTARGGGAAPNITVNYAPVIQGAGLSAEELAAVLEKDRAALIDQITEAAKGF
jgi:chromosome segregation and condensation protein ScpB